METRKITLEELYNFIKAKFELNDKRLEYLESKMDSNFKLIAGRFDQVDSKFAQMESKFEQVNDRFEQVNDRFNQLEKRMGNLEEKVQAVYESRDKVTMQFNRRVLLGNSVLAGIVAFFVALITGRYSTS